jgi:glutathione S-transferase
MAIKLHRCGTTWLRVDRHHCWRVEKALKLQNIPYETVEHPTNRNRRDDIIALTGQKFYPVIEFEDGTFYHEQSKAMARTIADGELDSKRSGG